MDLILLKDFLAHYSLQTVIIASATAILVVIINFIFKNKISGVFGALLPFALSIISYAVYDVFIASDKMCFRTETLYGGIMCGSLSTVIISIINRIKSGKPVSVSPTLLLIESLLSEFVDQTVLSATALEIDNLINENHQESAVSLREKICAKIKKVSPSLTHTQSLFAATIIIEAVKILNDENLKTKVKK